MTETSHFLDKTQYPWCTRTIASSCLLLISHILTSAWHHTEEKHARLIPATVLSPVEMGNRANPLRDRHYQSNGQAFQAPEGAGGAPTRRPSFYGKRYPFPS